mmetsp:Transcript_28062/g.84615  ORF Transcript_28062/g.84615 Transcript_28062/m.84615 type:complete len:287 (-) Transcript_28062:1730-2590(-)
MGSPKQPNFIFISLPILPVSTGPVWIPMCIPISGRPWRENSSVSSRAASCCASAAAQALAAWHSTLSGVFQNTSRPGGSVMISPTTPSKHSTIRVMTEKYLVSMRRKSDCGRCSDKPAASWITENMMVTSRGSTWSRVARWSPWTMCRTTVSGTNRAKASVPRDSEQKACCSLATSRIRENSPSQRRSSSPDSSVKSRSANLRIKSLRRCKGAITTQLRQRLSVVPMATMPTSSEMPRTAAFLARLLQLWEKASRFAPTSRTTCLPCWRNEAAGSTTTMSHRVSRL